jgi:NTP pyrophosphatase (non-canonical NTP hydrolase)
LIAIFINNCIVKNHRKKNMTENVIQFPNMSEETFPSSHEEAQERLEEIRTEYCDAVAEDAFDVVMQVLYSYNMYPKTDEAKIKDVVFLEEAIKSVVYRYKNLPHTFQELSENTISITPEAQQELEKMKEKEKITVD